MAAVILRRLCRRGNVARGLFHFGIAGPALNPNSLPEGLTRQFSFLALQRRDCKVGHAFPFGRHFTLSARGLHEHALATSDACVRHSYEDADSQAAALALQHHLQTHSKAYLSDAVAVVEWAPSFVQRLVDLVKQMSQESAQVINEEPTSKAKRKKQNENAKHAQPVGELHFEKQVQVFFSTTDLNVREPILESLGMVPERRDALIQKLSAEAVDVQSLLFIVRWIQQLGFSRSSVGDIIEKDVGVLSYKSGEIESGLSALKDLSISEEEVLGLIMKYPLILKAEVVENITVLGVELRALPSKDVIIRKAILDNPILVHKYVKGCANGVLHFLRSYNLTDERLDNLIRRHHRLVFSDVEKKFKCNVKFLKDLGVSRHIIGKVINRSPSFLLHSLDDNLMARLDYFKSLGFTEAEFALLVSRYPNFFSVSLENRIKLVVEELKKLGLTEEGLKKVVMYRPSMFAFKLGGGELSTLISGLKETNYSEKQKVTAFIKLFSRGIDHRKRCEDCLTQQGLLPLEAKQVLDKDPSILGYNEKAITFRIDHLTKTLGLPVQNVVWVPQYLSFRFQSRILRRQRVLAYMKTKGLLPDAFTLKELVLLSNTQFYNIFVKPHAEDQELSNIWLKDREGMGQVDGLNFIQSYTGSGAEAHVSV